VVAKISQWTPERVAILARYVAESVAATGDVDWSLAGQMLHVSANAASIRYRQGARAGEFPVLAVLRDHFKRGQASPFAGPPSVASASGQEVQTKTTQDGIEARSAGPRIKTVEDLLAHIEADMTRYEIASCEATKYEMGTKNDKGDPIVTEMHRVFVRLKPKAGPSVQELVGTIIDAAYEKRRPASVVKPAASSGDVLQVLVVADPHIGKYAWNEETGQGDYDMPIAVRLLREASSELLTVSKRHGVGRRLIACLGDYFHYDTPAGTTTKGTMLDRDGRVQKMIDLGARALFDMVEASARLSPTTVLLVPGNHDQVLTWALQRILQSHFRDDARVTIDTGVSSRKYFRWGKTLLGFTHGDKAPKKLPGLMALERAPEWGTTTYREIHRGHLHHVAAVETIDGVITRTAPSLSALDTWHAEEGYLGAVRAMETYFYHTSGRLVCMDSSVPVEPPPRRSS
jgi:metallophosphoesterase superfamily enzyme